MKVGRYLGGSADVGEGLSVVFPLADVQQPLRRRYVLEQVAHLQEDSVFIYFESHSHQKRNKNL